VRAGAAAALLVLLLAPPARASAHAFATARAASRATAPRESLVAVTAASRLYRITFRSPSGHPAIATLRLPRDPTAGALWGAVIAGGFGGGWRSAAEIDPGPGVALLSVDYPYVGRRARIPARDIILRGPALWRATHEMSALLIQAGDYLARRGDVDSTRIAVVGASLGAPFALHAAARSQRFRAVAILYGQADLSDWVRRNLRGVPGWARPAIGGLAALLYRDYEPARLAPRISPRPLLLVNGRGDERVSEEGARALYGAARAPRQQVWLEGLHVGLGRERIMSRLFEVTARWFRSRAFAAADSAGAG
jgi:fermentation-respiration switch protein FrsA (DUF1100 family)